jgi:hypothetical protein
VDPEEAAHLCAMCGGEKVLNVLLMCC